MFSFPENTLFSQHWLELICKTSPGVYCLGEDFYLFTLFTIIYVLLFTIFTVASWVHCGNFYFSENFTIFVHFHICWHKIVSFNLCHSYSSVIFKFQRFAISLFFLVSFAWRFVNFISAFEEVNSVFYILIYALSFISFSICLGLVSYFCPNSLSWICTLLICSLFFLI